ncbi:hypothetical protein IAT38_006933 [Cryptococcus sp. DSM 104549]
MSESTTDRLDLIDARMRAQTEATDKVQSSIADLRTSIASDVQQSMQDLVTQRDDTSVKSEMSEVMKMMTLVLNSNKAIAKRLDTLEASVKAQQASQASLEAHVLAIKPMPQTPTASTSSAVSSTPSASTAPKSAPVQPGAATPRTNAASSPVPPPAKTSTPINSKAFFESLYKPPTPPNTSTHHALTLNQAQWFAILKNQIKVATQDRVAQPPSTLDLADTIARDHRATRFVTWYFPKHGISRPVFKQTKTASSGKGTLDESTAWEVEMIMSGEVVWKAKGSYEFAEQGRATLDLSRALISIDPTAWKQFYEHEQA